MLSLSTLHTTLAHVLAPPHLHTAILFTTAGQLISYASNNNHRDSNDFQISYNDGNDSNNNDGNNNYSNNDSNNHSNDSNNNYANPPFTSNVAPNSPASTLKPKSPRSPTKSTSSTLIPSSAPGPGTEVYADSDADANTNADASVGATGGVSTGVGGVSTGIGIGALGARRAAVARGSRSKDDIRVLVGLGSELWGETKGAGLGMVDSELGRIVVVPILALPSSSPSALPSASALPSTPSTLPYTSAPPPAEAGSKDESTISEIEKEKDTQNEKEKKEKEKEKGTEQKDAPDAPLMLLALNGTDDESWDEMRAKATSLAAHLAPPLSKYREYLVVAPPPLPLAGGVVPPGGSSVSGVASPARARAVHVGGRI